MLGSIKVRQIISTIADCIPSIKENFIHDSLKQEKNYEILKDFLEGRGPPKIFVYYQVQDIYSQDELKEANADMLLYLTHAENERLKDKAVYFIRNAAEGKPINIHDKSDDIIFGELSPSLLVQVNQVMNNIYGPMLEALEDQDWGLCDNESRKEFLGLAKKFEEELDQAVTSLNTECDICVLDHEELSKIPEQDKTGYYERQFDKWLTQIDMMLKEEPEVKQPNSQEPGPDTELDQWRKRMQRIMGLSEQLKSKDFQTVKLALSKSKQLDMTRARDDSSVAKLMAKYNQLDILITDKLNEAKDNVKYLSTLEKFFDPLFNGTPQDIIDSLPALMNAIKMIHTIARYYSSTDKMTTLFIKITNQMIKNCKNYLLEGQNNNPKVLWTKDPEELIAKMQKCIELNHAYQEQYDITKERVAELIKGKQGKQFDFNDVQIFIKFDRFCKRLNKLIEIFSTIQQFNTLQKHNLEGLDKLMSKFKDALEPLKNRASDLLEINNHFDRDIVKFNSEISQLDGELQAFIDNNFSKFRNIEYSLKLLQRFQNILKRDSLRHNLIRKYNTILHNYGAELETILKIFSELRNSPPLVRNMPPEAGKIIWAEHLFQRIRGPITSFPTNEINSSEMRKYFGSYNKLGGQLYLYKMWYQMSWCEDIERAKAGLQATLIIRNDLDKSLIVNFDKDIMQLIREAKCMNRAGIDIPESARIILLQEEKFKMYYNELHYVLKEYERIIGKIKPITKTLLGPHIEDLELKLRPGMITLTWTSMNIDSYLHSVHQGLSKLEQLIISVNDIIENRVENNLKKVSKVMLVNLPQDKGSLSLDQFVERQEEYIKHQTEFLISKNVEIERAVDDLLQTIMLYPLDPHVDPISMEEASKIKKYYFWYLYQALLNATQNSLNAMKYRVCGKRGTGQSQAQLKPFFEVDVQLEGQTVELRPSLDEIQRAINRAATAVLRCSKTLYNWDSHDKDQEKRASFYEMIANDKEIVKVILLLTGSIQGTRNKIVEFKQTFAKFEHLWVQNISDSLKKFEKKHPSLQDYEEKLKEYTNIEEQIEQIEPVHKIGAMALKTANLKQGLKECAKDWKNSFARDLHKRARTQLEQLTEQTKILQQKIKKPVKDIDSLGFVMKTLEEIRKDQAEINMKFGPVMEMYQLLDNYLPGGISDKEEMDARSMLGPNWEKLITESEDKQKELQTKQGKHLKELKDAIKQFIIDVTDFRKEFDTKGPMVPGIEPKEAIERLRRFEDEYTVKDRLFKIYFSGEELFGLPHQSYPELERTESEIKNLKKLYSLYSEVIETITKWREKAWSDLSMDLITEMEEQISKYSEQCARLPKDLKEWNAYKKLKQEIDDLKEILPMIKELRKPSIRDRHWQAIISVTGKQLNYEHEDIFLMDDIIKAKLLNHKEDVEDIIDSADKQLKIERQLEEIKALWDDAEFEFGSWKSREYSCTLGGNRVLEIQEKLEEDQMTLASLNAMRHVTPFKDKVTEKAAQLYDVSETLDKWFKVQQLWTSLEAVFTGGDIAQQMPLEAKKFAGIDKTWIKIMEKAAESKKVLSCCQNDMLKSFLEPLQDGLDTCQKSLEQYLEGKRKKFPRFYFVSDPVLLKILSQGSDPTSIQSDFEKLFDAINKVKFEKGDKKSNEKIITQIISLMGKDEEECVDLQPPVKCEGKIEEWLLKLETGMQVSLKEIAKIAANNVLSTPLKEFVKRQVSQIALLGIQIYWTAKQEENFDRPVKHDKNKQDDIAEMMNILKQVCRSEEVTTSLDRIKFETLVTIQVHQRDITLQLKANPQVKSAQDFEWQKQTRFYWRGGEIDDCVISITDWNSDYCYEYLGAKERLAITPLTDRCYITLAQALSMYYGGAPAGPAGTGKTETVKDMGRTLGIFVVVTNCSDQHRYKNMAQIFKGLCQSGLWGCFDEFNRIHLEVLSVVAMQVESISTAKKHNVKQFMFPGETLPLQIRQTVGYFITMNPGYAGRQELPENLKVLFRGVSMMVPDRQVIMKVKLAAVGYDYDEVLAKKFKVLYGLCEEQLSKQRHYDFGLRNILSVLRTAGNIKRNEPNTDEETLLMRTLKSMNLSKLVADDIPLFESLLRDIFPTVKLVEKQTQPEVNKAVIQSCEKKNIIAHDTWVLKIMQLYETSLVRHGFMLVGPTGSGKTTIINVLLSALTDYLNKPTRPQTLNPKAITSEEMYGVRNELSDEWTPGIFSTIWERANVRGNKSTWIICDGPVDAIWIENLNTVLDDNKILTLASGDRIPMTENCKLVFEVENLNNASPATVSRCGIVFVSSTDLGYEPILKGWILSRRLLNRNDEADKLDKILTKYFVTWRLIENIEKTCKEPVMDLSPVIKLSNTLNLLSGCLLKVVSVNKTLSEEDYEKYVLYSLCWGVGGIYENKDRQQFHEYLSGRNAPLPKGKENLNIFDFYVNFDDKNYSNEWKIYTPEQWKPVEPFKFSQILLPTVDSMRAEYLIEYVQRQQRSSLCSQSVLLTGGSGTAKTSSVLMFAEKTKKFDKLFKRINFSSATSPSMFQQSIEVECDAKVGKAFAPPGNKQMIVFIDDLSMPFINEWGDQITLEIVRQLIEQGGFYMLDKTQRGNFKTIINLSYIGAMNHPGGGRNDIPNRLKRQFFIFNMILPENIDGIFGQILKYVFKPKFYSQEVLDVVENLTQATIRLWTTVKDKMLPTPSKFHYVFNLRELSRVFKGIQQIKKEEVKVCSTLKNFKSELYMIALWKHECERVFVDKLTNIKDKNIIIDYIQDIGMETYRKYEGEIVEKLSKDKPIYFCDFLREDIINEDGVVEVEAEKVYEAIADMEQLRKRVQQLLDMYNKNYPSKKMNLVLFDDALKHLLRISRIIKMQRSNGLLVGVGGSGKQSLTRLAAFIGKQVVQQIVLTKGFGENQLKDELKKLFDLAGHLGKQTTFIMTDSEVKKEEFLEYINMILSTGEIAGLIAKDEREAWLGDIRASYNKERGLPANLDVPQNELQSYFFERFRDNLHIILCFSPVGQKFRDRARKFPSLFNECTIDWFLPWPEEALVSVAQTFIANFQELDTKPEIKVELQKHMGSVHLMVNAVCDLYFQRMRRQVYVTPKSYLSFINMYKSLYLSKYEELHVSESSYKVGLQKIREAADAIAEMGVALKEEEGQLKEASDKTEVLLKNLDKENKRAEAKADEVKGKSEKCEKDAQEISREKEAAEKDLAAALPALKKADDAVRSLSPKDIQELRTLGSKPQPLEMIKYTIDSVSILLQNKMGPINVMDKTIKGKEYRVFNDSYDYDENPNAKGGGYGRSTLQDNNFMKKLLDFERDAINDETIELLEPYFAQEEWFNEAYAKQVNVACLGLCKWVFALAEYHEKSKIVKPKKIKLDIEEARLEVAQNELSKAREELQEVRKQQEALKAQYNKQMDEKSSLEERSRKTKKKIEQAKRLIDSLKDERERWTKDANEIAQKKKELVGNVSLACSFISYCGPFNSEFRTMLVKEYFIQDMKKRNIPVQPTLDLTAFLVDDATIGEWNLQGLPKDDLSIQNGIMLTNSTRFPLLIDPQGQGQKWLVSKYAHVIERNRCITTLSNPKFKEFCLKHCIENGLPLIIEGIENEVDPTLDPILERQYINRGKSKYVDVGGNEYGWADDFIMFMTCRLSNPAFSPELSAKTTIIDFTVTQNGLEQQLLGVVLSKEQKILEDTLNQLLADVNNNKKTLKQLDKSLLQKLTSSKGNLLEDTELVEVLNNTKSQAKDVEVKLADAEVKEKEIKEKREHYRPVATRGSVLYFCIIEVSLVSWMYNSSLKQFLDLFDYSINNSEKATVTQKRVENITKYLTYHVYRYVNRGLFEKDKTTFLLMICFKILTTANVVSSNDISLFLKGRKALTSEPDRQKPLKELDDNCWANVLALSRHSFVNESNICFFKDLPDSLSRFAPDWSKWLMRTDPENALIPGDYQERINNEKDLGSFLKLCLLRCIKEDRTLIASKMFIRDHLGKEFTDPVTDSLESIWAESTPIKPVLFLLSAGADPTSSIDDLAKRKKKQPVEKVSMGEGQEKVAEEVIKRLTPIGGWVVLQNCHLGLKFMEDLESQLAEQKVTDFHEDFRLWITTEPTTRFPLAMLQRAIKVTNEPPKGLKAGLHKTFTTTINQDFLEKIEHTAWRAQIFTLCFLHSVVIERRKFGPLGWCVPYEFNNSDLEASLQFIEKYMSNLLSTTNSVTGNAGINFEVIRYMICQVQYGGRITDEMDRGLFDTYGLQYFRENIFNPEATIVDFFVDTGARDAKGPIKEKIRYVIPNSTEIQRYRDYVDSLPEIDSPEVFGLHPNADITFRLKESNEMIDVIMETRPKEGGTGTGKGREEIVYEQVSDLLKNQVPPDFNENDVIECIKKLPGPKKIDKGPTVPLNIFLRQEIQRMQRVISLVRKTLNDIKLAIEGQIIMTPDILDAINALFDGKVPQRWVYDASGAEISWLIPGYIRWFGDLGKRQEQLNVWLRNDRPASYWLGGFFNPQGFLTAVKQEVARLKVTGPKRPQDKDKGGSWSLDEVTYKTLVKDEKFDPAKDPDQDGGVYIHNLILEGARLNRGVLDELDGKETKAKLPILFVTATNDKNVDKEKYQCPVYKYQRRTDKYYIFSVSLNCDASANAAHWKLRGVALLCHID